MNLPNTTILAIDTSCDETSVAVVQGHTILSNVIASQAQLHQQYGGVFPTVAKQAHRENINPTTQLALSRAGTTWDEIDAIAVTAGPGLAPALEIGLTYAKTKAQEHNKPLLAVNHIEGHVLSVLAEPNRRTTAPDPAPDFPALAIIVSGGHTEFDLVTTYGSYQRLGWTIDDAAGEALDKVGRMLDLGYPAGPIIEAFAQKGDATRFEFPLPMTTSGDYNLSFSGLKTYSRNLIRDLEEQNKLTKQTIYDFAASFQAAVIRHITHKLEKVLSDYPDLKEVWIGGGVAANIALRRAIRSTISHHQKNLRKKGLSPAPILVRTPYTKKLCGDNAAMIGVVGTHLLKSQHTTNPNAIDRRPRWHLGDA